MYDALPSYSRSARALLALAFGSVALLSACDTDQAVAPSPAATAPSKPNEALSPLNSGNLVIKVVDQNQNPITNAAFVTGFKVTGPNNITWVEWDEDGKDYAPGMGVVLRKNMTPGLYKVCEFSPPPTYGVVGMSCRFANVYVGATSGVVFTNLPATHVKFTIKDQSQKLIGGFASFNLDTSGVALVQGVTDNGALDLDPVEGKVDVEVRFESTFKVCVNQLPFGYILLPNQPACVSKSIKMGAGTVDYGNFGIIKQFSASWQVTDWVGGLLGPSTFEIYFNGNYITDFVDNVSWDDDPTLGKMAVTLPFAGDYKVCEKVPPAGHWLPQQPCKQFTVASGVPVSLGNFVNPEAQVPGGPWVP
jgi:hypothetical protein